MPSWPHGAVQAISWPDRAPGRDGRVAEGRHHQGEGQAACRSAGDTGTSKSIVAVSDVTSGQDLTR